MLNEDIQNSDDEIRVVNERRQARFVLLSEAGMVAGCVLVFFGFLSILIRAFFPQGTSLIVGPAGSVLADKSWSGDVELSIDAAGGEVERY